jgi:competence protein ComEA
MPTPSEQKALTFIAIVALLGGVARVTGASSSAAPLPVAAEQQALARQTSAVDNASSAQAGKRRKGASARSSSGRRRDTPVVVGGVTSVPFSDVRPGASPRSLFPPASPRIDSYGSAGTGVSFPPSPARLAKPARAGKGAHGTAPAGPIDLDVAGAAEIETLPRIGPALAQRIVADREAAGPFGSLEGLRRVRGIGAATASLLAPLVTFSRQPAARR